MTASDFEKDLYSQVRFKTIHGIDAWYKEVHQFLNEGSLGYYDDSLVKFFKAVGDEQRLLHGG